MQFLQKLSPAWPLRIGLGAMYLYSGFDMARHPGAWQWAVESLPDFLQIPIRQIGIGTYLTLQGFGEIALAVALFAWFLPRSLVRLAAILAALEMIFILVFVGVDLITFRDVGLAGAAVALFLLLSSSKQGTDSF